MNGPTVNREEEILESLPALFFFLSISTTRTELLDGYFVDPEELLRSPDQSVIDRLTSAVVDRGVPTLLGPREDVLLHLGRTATELSFGVLTPLNRPGYRLSRFAECFRPLARIVAASPDFTWWWEGAQTHRVTAKDIGISHREDLTEQSHWSNQPRSAQTIQTTPGPIESLESTMAVCFDNDTAFAGDNRTLPLAKNDPCGQGLRITSPSDWQDLLSVAHTVVTDDGRLHYWSDMLGTQRKWVTPDWQTISQSFDWIELTLGGFLTTSYRTIEFDGSMSAVIGWTPGATIFFNEDPDEYLGWASMSSR